MSGTLGYLSRKRSLRQGVLVPCSTAATALAIVSPFLAEWAHLRLGAPQLVRVPAKLAAQHPVC